MLVQLDESSKSSKVLSSVDIKQLHIQLEEKNKVRVVIHKKKNYYLLPFSTSISTVPYLRYQL